MKLPQDVMLDTIIKTVSADLSVEILRQKQESFVISNSRNLLLLLTNNLFVMIFVKNYWKNMNIWLKQDLIIVILFSMESLFASNQIIGQMIVEMARLNLVKNVMEVLDAPLTVRLTQQIIGFAHLQ